jgi:hypothetical protein
MLDYPKVGSMVTLTNGAVVRLVSVSGGRVDGKWIVRCGVKLPKGLGITGKGMRYVSISELKGYENVAQ